MSLVASVADADGGDIYGICRYRMMSLQGYESHIAADVVEVVVAVVMRIQQVQLRQQP